MLNMHVLNGEIQEEISIEQCEGFILGNYKNIVCKLNKKIYGLKRIFMHGINVFTSIFSNKDSRKDTQITISMSNMTKTNFW